MSGFNLPPGVSARDIPGNDPDDGPLDWDELDSSIGVLLGETPEVDHALDALAFDPLPGLSQSVRVCEPKPVDSAFERTHALRPAAFVWVGCGECDETFECNRGAARCIRLHPR